MTIRLPHGEQRLGVTGAGERNLKIIRETLGVKITARNGSLRLSGGSDAVGRAADVLERLDDAARNDTPMDRRALLETITATEAQDRRGHASRNGDRQPAPAAPGDHLDVYLPGKRIKPLTDGQTAYLDTLLNHDLTLCTGPAGTGKTYVAVAAAVAMLKRGDVRKLVLVRPAVEAGEKLGFLPGSMQEKVNPYLRPLLDALHDMMDFDQIQRYMACDLIEIVPLAFMRGRTLNDALIILDEAQNTTKGQMLMFLTRLGHNSKMIVTGDTSQIDLEDPRESGLVDAIHRLRRTRGVAMVALEPTDIVRHNLVQRVLSAYNQHPAQQLRNNPRADEELTDSEPPTTDA
ncbi:MAG: PhoH family protein [Phycisphaeraceae bacterium]